MRDQRKQKIADLKTQIKTEKQLVQDAILAKQELSEDPEKQKEQVREFRDKLAVSRTKIKDAEEELKLVRMNEYSSSFFEWHPHKGMNRKQARLFRRTMKQRA